MHDDAANVARPADAADSADPADPVDRADHADHADHPVAIVVVDGLSAFEFAVAYEVFSGDPPSPGRPWYRTTVCSPGGAPVRIEGGLALAGNSGLEAVERARTVVVPPTDDPGDVPGTVLEALRRAHRRGGRVLSLCTGAFVLGAAGLLDGRPATTHWREAAELARRYPAVRVDPDVLYVDDGDVLTSAGSAASIDLCLHVVRADFGAEVAAQLARTLVVPPHRDGGQAQYIEMPTAALDPPDPFTDALAWVQAHLSEEVRVDELARRAAMSPRTFARRFRAHTGTTPYRWLLRQRVGLAQRLLESSDRSIDRVAQLSGLGTATNLRKHFTALLRTSPQAYRRAFGSADRPSADEARPREGARGR